MSPANEGRPATRSDSPEPNETGSSPLAASDGRATTRRHLLASVAGAGFAAVAGVGAARAAGTTGGDELWRVETDADSVTSPTVVGGTVYVGTAAENGGTDYEGVVYALSGASGDERWRQEYDHVPIRAAPSVVDGTVFVPEFGVSALDRETGDFRWDSEEPGPEGWSPPPLEASPTVFEGTVYTNGVVALNTAVGNVQWEGEATWNSNSGAPVVADGTVFTTDRYNTVYAYDVDSGAERWHVKLESEHLGSPTTADDAVFVADRLRGGVYALDQETGERRWAVSTDHWLETRPTIFDDTLLVGSDGVIHAIDTDEGSTGRRYDAAVSVPRRQNPLAPTAVGDTLFAGDSSSIYALDLVDGSVSWRFETGSEMTSSPIVVDGTLYAGAANGTIYALDAGVSGSSEDSRVLRGTDGHHHAWAEEAAAESDPAEFAVEIDTESSSVVGATKTEVRITVENVGKQSGERTVQFHGHNLRDFEKSIALDGGESRTLTRTVVPPRSEEGNEIAMTASLYEDEDETSIAVTRPPSGLEQLPGFGPLGAIGGVGGAAYLLKRRLDGEDP